MTEQNTTAGNDITVSVVDRNLRGGAKCTVQITVGESTSSPVDPTILVDAILDEAGIYNLTDRVRDAQKTQRGLEHRLANMQQRAERAEQTLAERPASKARSRVTPPRAKEEIARSATLSISDKLFTLETEQEADEIAEVVLTGIEEGRSNPDASVNEIAHLVADDQGEKRWGKEGLRRVRIAIRRAVREDRKNRE